MVCEWPVVYPVCDSPTGNEFLSGECAPGGFVATRREGKAPGGCRRRARRWSVGRYLAGQRP